MEKRYLKKYELNICKGLNELYELVKKDGGYIVSEWNDKQKQLYIHSYETGDPVMYSYFENYIHFMINNDVYYVQFDENPFFPDYYTKEKTINEQGSRDYYSDDLKKEYFSYSNMSDDEIRQAAARLYNDLLTANYSKHYIEYTRVRIPNIYNGGYHYEKIAKPERKVIYKKVSLENE